MKLRKILTVSILTAVLVLPILALAQGTTPVPQGGFGTSSDYVHSGLLPNPLRVSSIGDLINKIIDYLIIIAAPILTIMVLIGAFQIMFAEGNSEKWQTGKKTIVYAVIGYAIILLSKGISSLIANFFG